MTSLLTLGEELEDLFKYNWFLGYDSMDYFINKECRNLPQEFEPTVRRLRFVIDLIPHIGARIETLILSGSMGYGRFYSVKDEKARSSDIDFLVFTNEGSEELFDEIG
jgi:hypothetical protein